MRPAEQEHNIRYVEDCVEDVGSKAADDLPEGTVDRKQEIQALEQDWATNPRWKGVKRGYGAEDVVRLRGSLKINGDIVAPIDVEWEALK